MSDCALAELLWKVPENIGMPLSFLQDPLLNMHEEGEDKARQKGWRFLPTLSKLNLRLRSSCVFFVLASHG